MNTKIKHIRITNFLGLSDVSVTIDKPINFFLGKNRAGKSSLAAAFEFLHTGMARGISFKKDRRALVTNGASKGEIVFTMADGAVIRRNVGTGELSVTSQNQTFRQFPYPLNPVCLNPNLYFELGEKDRHELLYLLIGKSAITVDSIENRLIEAGALADMAKKAAGMVLDIGWDQTHDAAVESRREAKRKLADCERVPKPAGTIIVEDEAFDLTNGKAIADQLNEVTRERDAKHVLLGRLADRRTSTQINAEIATTEALLAEVLGLKPADTRQTEDAIKKLMPAIESAKRDVKAAETAKKLVADGLDTKIPNIAFEKCPIMGDMVCPVSQDDRDKYVKMLTGRIRRAEETTRQANEDLARAKDSLSAKEAQLEEFTAELDRADIASKKRIADADKCRNDIAALKQELADMPEGSPETLRHEIDMLDDSRKRLTEAARAVMAFTEKEGEYHTAIRERPLLKAKIDALNVLCDALSPDGVRKTFTAESSEGFGTHVENVAKSCFSVKMAIDKDSGLPMLDGRHYPFLSKSEQWVCRLVVQDAIAFFSKSAWLIIDEADILDFSWRSNLVDFLETCSGAYDFVGIFATQNAVEAKVPVDDQMAGWVVSDGKVEAL